MTQQEFADRIGISQAYLSNVEHGKVEVGAEILRRIAEETVQVGNPARRLGELCPQAPVSPPATPDTIVSLALLSRRGQRFALLDDERDQHLARCRPRTFCPMNLFSRDEVSLARFHRHSRRALLVLDNSALLYIGEEFTGMGVSRFSGARR